MDLDGKNDIMLSENKIYNLNVSDNGIFYLNYVYSKTTNEVESLAIYRMDLDGKNNRKLYTLEESSNSICLVKDWVFFLDSNEEHGFMTLISPDGREKIDLFTLNYEDYYYKEQLIEEENKESTEEEKVDEEIVEVENKDLDVVIE